MDEQALHQLDQDAVIIVPTGSLATHLDEVYANQQIAQGQHVWESPNIVTWSELLRILWHENRSQIDDCHSLVSTPQAKLLWTQVIEKSKYQDEELTLLNVQQTVRACLRSDRLMADWLCDENSMAQDHVTDVEQFLTWRAGFQNELSRRQVLDESRLQQRLTQLALQGSLKCRFTKIIWYAYDLVTAAQHSFNQGLQSNGVEIDFGGPQEKTSAVEFVKYESEKDELISVFERSRALLEQQPDLKIHIMIPDLQHRYAKVQDIARTTFYPSLSIAQTQTNNLVYRFSLGKALQDWPAIESALCVLNLLRSKIALGDLSYLLRSAYFGVVSKHSQVFKLFEIWLRNKRIRNIGIDKLSQLVAEFSVELEQKGSEVSTQELVEFVDRLSEFRSSLDARLQNQKQHTGYSAIGFMDWADVFAQWLLLWEWRTHGAEIEANPVSQQLKRRWDMLLDEFSSLASIQRSVGLSGALSNLQQLVRDAIFLPKSSMSPIVISGLLEALGREVDVCFVSGMSQDFPPPNKNDAFIPRHQLVNTGYPDASPQSSVTQAQKVMSNLISAATSAQISFAVYAAQNQDTPNQPSPLFLSEFSGVVVETSQLPATELPSVTLDSYIDVQGPEWKSPQKARGGASIFKNQSQCAFRAFVTHQLRFEKDEEPEFGLDHLDRGNLTHKMLECVWEKLPNQNALLALSERQQQQLLEDAFTRVLEQSQQDLTEDKLRLFGLEKPRVVALVDEWLNLERERPTNFTVVEREQKYRGQWAQIKFDYIIDRVDITQSGQRVILDYKTGSVARADWQGDRPREPQLPLYSLVHEANRQSGVAGIAVAQVRRGDAKFVELSEVDIFRKSSSPAIKTEQEWRLSKQQWPDIFTRLAQEFLAGKADVNPLDKKCCQYCDLSAVCRVQELRAKSGQLSSQDVADDF